MLAMDRPVEDRVALFLGAVVTREQRSDGCKVRKTRQTLAHDGFVVVRIIATFIIVDNFCRSSCSRLP